MNTTGFEGSLNGIWSGGCSSGGVAGTFQITVARDGSVAGTFDGDAEGDISGAVLPNGSFDASAEGSAGGCLWSGTLSIAGGTLTGSGTWQCGEAVCSGVFSGE